MEEGRTHYGSNPSYLSRKRGYTKEYKPNAVWAEVKGWPNKPGKQSNEKRKGKPGRGELSTSGQRPGR